MEENSVLIDYIDMFGRVPPLLISMTYEDEFYIFIMKQAIEKEEKITEEVLERELRKHNIVYDMED